MKQPVRFGILSFAHYHANFWAELVAASPDAALVGVWDDDPQRGRQAAERFGVHFFARRSDLLAACDAVGVTSETVHHAQLIEDAAAAGVHVLCEKPMATTLADCDRIRRAVHDSGVIFMQNLPKRFDPVNRALVDLVRRDELGKIVMARVRHGHSHGFSESFRRQWFVNPHLSGGGTLLDEGVHAADFLLWLLGDPERVTATISSRALGLEVEDTACATFTFVSGALGEISTSWSFLAAEGSIEVYGTDGAAMISGVDLASRDFASAPYLRIFRRGDPTGTWQRSPIVPYFVSGNFHQQGPSHFIACLRDGMPPCVDVEQGRTSVQMVLAAYRSAATGQTQPVLSELMQDGV